MKAFGYYVWIVATLLWRGLVYVCSLGRISAVLLGVTLAGCGEMPPNFRENPTVLDEPIRDSQLTPTDPQRWHP